MATWIRRKIVSDILKAIQANDRSTHVFYITGYGGEGKTILLRQIGMELDSADGIGSSFRWSGILDLYHSDVNSNSGLEARLSEALETANDFQPYRDERDAYKAHREAGKTGVELEEERVHMAQVFAQCMNAATKERRVVIALDTIERIQYELDEVQEFCQLEDEGTTVRPWLLEQLRQWQNCVVLLVGRPERKPYLEAALANALGGNTHIRYVHRTLGGFDKDEALDYFKQREQDFLALRDLDAMVRHRLWEVTEGRPIRLDLALEVVQHQLGFDRFWKNIASLSTEAAHKAINRLLIDHVMNGEPDQSVRDVLRYLAIARKGLDAELLHHLAGQWDIGECQQKLDTVAKRSFVKRRPDDGRLFLHDEMYEWCDKDMLQPGSVQELSDQVVKWYDEKIDALGVGTETQEKRRNYEVDSLLYRMRSDPRVGYEWYFRHTEEAILAIEVGFDMRLRNELLAFLQSTSAIDQKILTATAQLRREISYDCAARWVKRYVFRGQNVKAVSVAEKILEPPDSPCLSNDPCFRLSHADLVVWYALALIYRGRAEKGVELLKATIADLEGEQKPEILAPQAPRSFDGWRRNFVLGWGHNHLGYAYWTSQAHYELALREFRSALPYFRASDLLEQTANVDDNMGRVYALLYDHSPAEALVEDGLELRRELGRKYRYALSLNSRAIVHLAFGEPHRARRMVEESLGIFENLGTQRGIGLACLTLGRSLRHLGTLGASGVYSTKDCDKLFADAISHLQRAIKIFERDVEEPVRQVETYNELGCAYRERAANERLGDPNSPLARSIARDAGRHLEKGCELAEKMGAPVLYVDSCEDLAQTYFQRGDFDNTEIWLRHAQERIPESYLIKKGSGLQEIAVEERVEEFWHQMGKIELLRGHLVYDRDEEARKAKSSKEKVSRAVLEEAIQHYVFAAAYFERFSPRAAGLETTLKQIYSRFKRCKIEDLRHMQTEVIPNLAKTYALDPSTLGRFFENTLGLALQLP
jgi:tetratricopeptide (TPR) repeat protein